MDLLENDAVTVWVNNTENESEITEQTDWCIL